jgi:CTP:molybdopterin cytidylyltransferase MocA
MRIAGIVLAAGAGRRAGGPKALLTLEGGSFLARTVSLLSRPGVEPVLAVLGHDAARVQREAGLPPSAETVVNAAYESGMLSSILCGLDRAEAGGADAIVVHPVDHPRVSVETIDRVIAALQAGARIAVPSWSGRRGHPAGFARETWAALRAAAPDRGARAVLADHPEWIIHVEGDPGCIAGVNTPEDYERIVAWKP